RLCGKDWSGVALICMAVSCRCGMAQVQEVVGRAPPLVSVIENEPVERGAIKVGEPVTRFVTLKNTSAAPVALRVVGTSCPCTSAKLSESLLDPGATCGL